VVEGVDVFVSYAHVDVEWAAWLAGCLEAAGLSTFVEAWDLLPGDRRTARLDAGIGGTSAAVLVCSAAAFADSELAAQYGALRARAAGSRVRLVPVLVDEVELPPLLADLEPVDFRATGGDEAASRAVFGRLLAAVTGAAPARRVPAGFSAAPDDRSRPEGPAVGVLRVGGGEVGLAGWEGLR
jgi:hypothetical protein